MNKKILIVVLFSLMSCTTRVLTERVYINTDSNDSTYKVTKVFIGPVIIYRDTCLINYK